MANKRLRYIDILKGFSILCIVLLHFEEGVFPLWLNWWIGNFMITAFYFTSGWLFGLKDQSVSVKDLCRKRWKSLGKPYLWFSLVIIIFDLILFIVGYYDLKIILREVYKTLTLRGIGTLWFLPALFGGEVIFVFLRNKKRLWLWGLALVLSLAYTYFYGYWATLYRNINATYQLIDAPFLTLNNIIRAWIVVACGYALQWGYTKTMAQKPMWLNVAMGAAVCGLSIYFSSFSTVNLYCFSIFFAPVLGPLGLLLLAMAAERLKCSRFFEYWGVNSLALMATHYSIVLVLFQMLNLYLYGQTKLTGVISLVFFVLAILIEYPIVEIINKRFKFLLGK